MKISDFKLAEYFIRNITKNINAPFTDFEVEFGSGVGNIFSNNKIIIGNSDKFAKTIVQIFSTYIMNLNLISGHNLLSNEEQICQINAVTAIMRDFTYSSTIFEEYYRDEIVKTNLNREHLIFSIMMHIVCPSFEKNINNINILHRKSPYLDGAKYIKLNEIEGDQTKFPAIFSNLDIENYPTRMAFLLFEAIKAHDLDAKQVIHEIFTKQELWTKFYGQLSIAFKQDNDINDFLTVLSILSDDMGSIDKRLVKTAQYSDINSTWWYLGIIEKMLGPARGNDWTVYYTMQPYVEELWTKTEKERKKRGLKELPFELLLRVQAEDYKQQPNLVLQGLLAEERVW
jgi:hypothetical protein